MTDPDSPPAFLRPLFLTTAALALLVLVPRAASSGDGLGVAGAVGLAVAFGSLGLEPRLLTGRSGDEPRPLRLQRALLGLGVALSCGALVLA